MNCYSWIKLIPVLIHLKYWYYNSSYLELPCLIHRLFKILPWPTRPHSTQSWSSSSLISLFCPTPFDHKPPQVLDIKAKPIKFIIKLYTDFSTFWVKHTTCRKFESLRASSLSNLNNMVNNNSIFDPKYVEFSTKWQVLLHFQNPTCA